MKSSRRLLRRVSSAVLWINSCLTLCILGLGSAGAQQNTPLPLGFQSTASTPPASPPPSTRARESNSLPAEVKPSPYRISGVVLDTVTNAPIPKVTLSAEPMTTVRKNHGTKRRFQNVADSVTSGSDGRFELAVASAGGWALTASGRNYRAQSLDEHDGYSTAVVLTEDVPTLDVTFHLTPSSVIEGFVLDEAGEAVRGATAVLLHIPPATPANQHPRPQARGQQMTDDRGLYKFNALGPGSYQIRITASPWYATNSSQAGFRVAGRGASPDSLASGPNPLDVVYPPVWFPGVTDQNAATAITLRGGETQEANFRLLPVPGSSLRITSSAVGSDAERDLITTLATTYLTRILPDGTEDPQQTPTRLDSRGNADIGGLSPGTYLVHQQQRSGQSSLSTIQVGGGSARTLDLSEGSPATNVTVRVDPAADLDSLQISFRDLQTGQVTYAQRIQDLRHQSLRRRRQSQDDSDSGPPESGTPRPDRTVSLMPGTYEVFLNGIGDVYLAAIEAAGATAAGRTVTIAGGAPKLFLHTATGLGTVSGIVTSHGQPDAGAMVLLIPATLGNPSGIDLPSRDQSNTDGSFEMSGLLPGGYILVAIDHGWEVNWSDAATLRRYLMHGVPLDIKPGADVKQALQAQSP